MLSTLRPTSPSGSDSDISWQVVDAPDSIDTNIRAGSCEVSPAFEDDFLVLASECISPPAHAPSTMLPPEATSSLLESPDSARLPGAEGMHKHTAGVADTTAGVAQLSLYPAHPNPAVRAMHAVPVGVLDQSAGQQTGPEAVRADATLASGADAGFAADAAVAVGLRGEMKHVPASSTGLGCKRAAPEAAFRPLRMRYTPYPAPSQGTTQSPPAAPSSPPAKGPTHSLRPAVKSSQHAFLPRSISLQQQHGAGLMQLQQGQRLGGPPSRHLSSSQLQDYSDTHSPRLHAYTQSQMWNHLQNKVDSGEADHPGLEDNVSAQPQAGVHAGSNQQDCSREFQMWDPFETGHQRQQGSYALSVMLQQQQHLPNGATQSCPQEANVVLQSQQQQQRQKQQQPYDYRSNTLCIQHLQSPTQQSQQQQHHHQQQQQQKRYNSMLAESFGRQQAQKHERYAPEAPAAQALLHGVSVAAEPVDLWGEDVADDVAPRASSSSAPVSWPYGDIPPPARGPYGYPIRGPYGLPSPARGPYSARGGHFDRRDEEERSLQEALEASAREYKEQHGMAVDADIVLPVHQTVHPLQRRTAESLPIRMDDDTVVWQNEQDSTSAAAASKGVDATGPDVVDTDMSAVSNKWASSSIVGIVRAAETLHQFARRHGCNTRAVAAINGLQPNTPVAADACILYPGQVLQLPEDRSNLWQGTTARLGAQVAKLGQNQSLEDFAKQHGTYATCVLAVNFNGLPAHPVLREGQVLQLP